MEQKLASLLRIIAYSQVDIEIAKTFIQKTMNTDPQCAFKIVDSASRGVVSNFEIANFLERHRVKAELDEIKMIVQYYDLKREGKLDFESFEHALTPRNKNIDQVIAYRKQEPARQLEDNIVNFFIKELELIRKAHDLRIQLHGTVGGHSFSFNRALDIDDKAAINYYDIDKFMQRQGIILSDIEISCVLERGDRYYHNVITYPDFEKYIVPDVVNKKVLAAQIDSQHLYNALSTRYTVKQIPNPTDSLIEKPDKKEQNSEKDDGIAVEIEPLYQVENHAVPLTESNYRYTSYFNDLDKYYRPSRNHYTSMISDYEREKKYITGEQILTGSNLGNERLKKRALDPYQYYDKTYPFVSTHTYNQPYHHQKYPYIAPYDLKNTSNTSKTNKSTTKSAATDYPLHMYMHTPTLPPESHDTYSVTETKDISPVPLPSTCYKVYERFPNYRYLSEAGNGENMYNLGVPSDSSIKGSGVLSSTYQPGLSSGLSRVGDKFSRNSGLQDKTDKTEAMLNRLSVYDRYNYNVSVKGTELYGREDLKKKVESVIMKNRFI